MYIRSQNMNVINYEKLLERFPWIIEKNKNCIISPDVDGILCGLFMSYYFEWKIVGYYDGKQLCCKKNCKPNECVFLDMEIYRRNYKSIGQHMVLYNKNYLPENWNNFDNCINPNILREFDANKNFKTKYPFGTIHLLLCIAKMKIDFIIPSSAITGLLYVDGTFKNLLNYPENCISWLYFLNAKDKNSPLSSLLNIFAKQKISSLMHDLESLFNEFRKIGNGKKGGDKIKLSEIVSESGSFSNQLKERTTSLLSLLSSLTGWSYKADYWTMSNLDVINLNKGIQQKLNIKNYFEILNNVPVSFAITGTKQLEYTHNHTIFN